MYLIAQHVDSSRVDARHSSVCLEESDSVMLQKAQRNQSRIVAQCQDRLLLDPDPLISNGLIPDLRFIIDHVFFHLCAANSLLMALIHWSFSPPFVASSYRGGLFSVTIATSTINYVLLSNRVILDGVSLSSLSLDLILLSYTTILSSVWLSASIISMG